MTPHALLWRPDRLELTTAEGCHRLPWVVPDQKRYWIGLDGRLPGRLLLRLPGLPVPLLEWRAPEARPLPAPPAPSCGDVHRWKVHPGRGWISFLDAPTLHLLEGGAWRQCPLPPDLEVRDVSFGQDALWVAGAAASRRNPGDEVEGALRVRIGQGGFAARSPRLGPLAALRTLRQGGLGALRTVDAREAPVLATSLCSWFAEDESSFLFQLGDRKDRAHRLADDTVRCIDRSGSEGPRVLTTGGVLWTLGTGRPRALDLRPALCRALRVDRRALVLSDADLEGPHLAVALTLAPEGRTVVSDLSDGSAICVSADSGRTFELVHRAGPGEGEWCGVAHAR